MISSTRGQEVPYAKIRGNAPPAADDTAFGDSRVDDTVASGGETSQSSEAEIARLTWVVLDGNASVADRQRLAQLVSAQHANRSA